MIVYGNNFDVHNRLPRQGAVFLGCPDHQPKILFALDHVSVGHHVPQLIHNHARARARRGLHQHDRWLDPRCLLRNTQFWGLRHGVED